MLTAEAAAFSRARSHRTEPDDLTEETAEQVEIKADEAEDA